MSATLSKLTTVFREVFNDDTIELSRETTADDVADWDSVMHVTLMLAVERAFEIKFTSGQVALLSDVGELLDLIDQLSPRAEQRM